MRLTVLKRSNHLALFLLTVLLVCSLTAVRAQSRPSQYVAEGADKKLVYKPDAAGNVIPDFSNCGYGGGGGKMPNAVDVPASVTIEPVQGDATAGIQQAIDQVSALPLDRRGFRGAVLIKKGKYS